MSDPWFKQMVAHFAELGGESKLDLLSELDDAENALAVEDAKLMAELESLDQRFAAIESFTEQLQRLEDEYRQDRLEHDRKMAAFEARCLKHAHFFDSVHASTIGWAIQRRMREFEHTVPDEEPS